MRRTVLGTALLAACIAAPLPAQSYKTTVETRRVNTGPLHVDLSFAIGELLIRPGDNGRSYRLAMTYAEDVFTPTVRFDDRRNRLTVELDGDDRHFGDRDLDLDDQRLDLALPRDPPLDLEITFGALEADLDFGGLNLRSAEIHTGASETTISFSEPTRGTCQRMEFTVGAAEFEVRQLGNAGCRYVAFKGGVGEVSLDFSGYRLRETTHLLVNVGLGEVRIRVPESVGIRLDADRFLASVDHEGLIKRGRYYVSPDYDAAASTLVIEVNAVLGSIELERVP